MFAVIYPALATAMPQQSPGVTQLEAMAAWRQSRGGQDATGPFGRSKRVAEISW